MWWNGFVWHLPNCATILGSTLVDESWWRVWGFNIVHHSPPARSPAQNMRCKQCKPSDGSSSRGSHHWNPAIWGSLRSRQSLSRMSWASYLGSPPGAWNQKIAIAMVTREGCKKKCEHYVNHTFWSDWVISTLWGKWYLCISIPHMAFHVCHL
jgi:hypothetical protein